MKYTIKVTSEDLKTTFFKYESSLLPTIGDQYAGSEFDDGKMRIVVGRLIIPIIDNVLIVITKIQYP